MCSGARLNHNDILNRAKGQSAITAISQKLVDRNAIREPFVSRHVGDVKRNETERGETAVHLDRNAATGCSHGAVDVHIKLKLATTPMTIDIDDFAISCIDNHVTTAVAHDIENHASAFYGHFRDIDIDSTIVVIAHFSLQIASNVAGEEFPRKWSNRISIDFRSHNFR